MSKFFTAAVLSFATFQASAVDQSVASFCRQPVATLCQDADEHAAQMDFHLKASQRLGLRAVRHKFPQIKAKDLTVKGLAKLKDKKLRDAAMAVYYNTITDAIKRHLGNADLVAQLHERRIIARLKKAIEAHKDVDKKETADMLEQLKVVKFVNAADVLTGSEWDEKLRDEIIENCERDGLVENAFAEQINGKNYVVICAGDLLAGFDRRESKLPPSQFLLSNEVWTLAHETGHHVDAGDHPIMYQKMLDCLNDNHRAAFQHDVNDYMTEITADHWGNEELASYLTLFKTPESKFEVLKRSLISICDTEDDGVHPPGNFRIEMTRRNPRIHKALGCPTPDQPEMARKEDATCTLKGKNEQVFWISGVKTGAAEPAASH